MHLGDLFSVEIAENESSYVIANVKPKPEDDNGYIQANIHDQPNVIDESGYAMMVINHDAIAGDKDGYLIPKANQKNGNYVNTTNHCAAGHPDVGIPNRNGKGITLICVFVSHLVIFV